MVKYSLLATCFFELVCVLLCHAVSLAAIPAPPAVQNEEQRLVPAREDERRYTVVADEHRYQEVGASLMREYGGGGNDGECQLYMFSSYTAFLACQAQYALQRNWYPSPISGLFSYQEWNGFDGFWQDGLVIESMTNLLAYVGNYTRYHNVVLSSYRYLDELLLAYGPSPSYDDMAWFGLSYIRVFEVLKNTEFRDMAKQIFDWNWQHGWDKRSGNCSGGMWFDFTLQSKVTITNVQMFHLGLKLHRTLNDSSYFNKSMMIWDFMTENKLVNYTTFLLADGINLTTCGSNQNYGPTYSPGVLAAGLAELAQQTGEHGYLDLAHRLAVGVIVRETRDGVLQEYCDVTGCDDDGRVFKGIFMRNLRYLHDASNQTMKNIYLPWMKRNVASLLANSTCYVQHSDPNSCKIDYRDGPPFFNATGPVFGTNWLGPFNYSAPMQQLSALDLLTAAIDPGATCLGSGCAYDPPTPPVPPLTCTPNPCPKGQDCCMYKQGYYTCCASNQKCSRGICV